MPCRYAGISTVIRSATVVLTSLYRKTQLSLASTLGGGVSVALPAERGQASGTSVGVTNSPDVHKEWSTVRSRASQRARKADVPRLCHAVRGWLFDRLINQQMNR